MANEEDGYETKIIENAIQKIGTLLALGFGDAGKKFIQKSMEHEGGGAALIQDLSEIGDGQKLQALFAFANIRHFEDSTEVMQEQVLLFVNQISEIVHSCVDKFGGSPNKNLGDTFLLVWKPETFINSEQKKLLKQP